MRQITLLHVPDPPLSEYVDHFFYYAGYEPEHEIDRMLPDGDVRLIFDLTEEPKPIFDNTTLREIQSCQRVWFSGFRTEPITIPSGRGAEMLLVQFRKGRTLPFLTDPMHALTNLVVDAELVFGRRILELRRRLVDARTPRRKFAILENELIVHSLSPHEENPFVDFAIARIVAAPDQCSIREVASQAGYTQKHLIQLFKKHVGVTPKEFLRVMRFQKVVQDIEMCRAVDWADIVHDCGFYDQSHFISEFKRFSGLTPTEYVRRRGDLMNYIPLADLP